MFLISVLVDVVGDIAEFRNVRSREDRANFWSPVPPMFITELDDELYPSWIAGRFDRSVTSS